MMALYAQFDTGEENGGLLGESDYKEKQCLKVI